MKLLNNSGIVHSRVARPGVYQLEATMREDLSKRKFGRWTVLRRADNLPRTKNIPWLCQCRCGTVRTVQDNNLLSGKSTSCGCKSRRHGGRKRPEYYIWRGMVCRCLDAKAADYPRYGGAGITLCKRWRDFALFLADMGPRPSPEHTIDRKDNRKGYSPGNCRWATRKEQGRNMSTNRLLTFRGETRCLAEWAEVLGKSRSEISLRLRRGWSVEDALTRPTKNNGRKFVPANGTTG